MTYCLAIIIAADLSFGHLPFPIEVHFPSTMQEVKEAAREQERDNYEREVSRYESGERDNLPSPPQEHSYDQSHNGFEIACSKSSTQVYV